MAEMTPAQIGAYHADEAVEDFAERMAGATEIGMVLTSPTPPVSPDNQEYLDAKASRFRKWQGVAAKQKRLFA